MGTLPGLWDSAAHLISVILHSPNPAISFLAVDLSIYSHGFLQRTVLVDSPPLSVPAPASHRGSCPVPALLAVSVCLAPVLAPGEAQTPLQAPVMQPGGRFLSLHVFKPNTAPEINREGDSPAAQGAVFSTFFPGTFKGAEESNSH